MMIISALPDMESLSQRIRLAECTCSHVHSARCLAIRKGGADMLCERCKMREASVVLTEVVNGVRTEHNLCSQCATETDLGQFFDTDFPFAKILSGILGITPETQDPQTEKMNQLACPTCKMTYGEFIKNSQFGCPDCYDTFGLLLNSNIK